MKKHLKVIVIKITSIFQFPKLSQVKSNDNAWFNAKRNLSFVKTKVIKT